MHLSRNRQYLYNTLQLNPRVILVKSGVKIWLAEEKTRQYMRQES